MANGSMRRAGQDHRGNSRDRAARRAWIASTMGVNGWVYCHLCGKRLKASASTWHVDRFPVPGHKGGRYIRGNIRPACPKCNLGYWSGRN